MLNNIVDNVEQCGQQNITLVNTVFISAEQVVAEQQAEISYLNAHRYKQPINVSIPYVGRSYVHG